MAEEDLKYALQIGRKVRKARENAKLSLRELARHVEVSASMVSQIENGKAYPSVRTLYNLANALSTPIDYFFPTDSAHDAPLSAVARDEVEVKATASELRASFISGETSGLEGGAVEGVPLSAQNRSTIVLKGGVTWSRLTSLTEDVVEFLEITYDPDASSGRSMSRHNGREFGLVMEGKLTLELGFETHVLGAGDSVVFDSNTPHRLSNVGDVPMRALWVIFGQDAGP